jgi:hypothetical protein
MAAPALNDAMVATELVFTTIGMVSSLTIAGSIRAALCPRLLRVSGSRLKPPCSNNQQVGGFALTFKYFLFFYSSGQTPEDIEASNEANKEGLRR